MKFNHYWPPWKKLFSHPLKTSTVATSWKKISGAHRQGFSMVPQAWCNASYLKYKINVVRATFSRTHHQQGWQWMNTS